MNTTESILISAKKATRTASQLSEKQINQLIEQIADAAISNIQLIIDENLKDEMTITVIATGFDGDPIVKKPEKSPEKLLEKNILNNEKAAHTIVNQKVTGFSGDELDIPTFLRRNKQK